MKIKLTKHNSEKHKSKEDKELLIGSAIIIILNLIGWTALFIAYYNI